MFRRRCFDPANNMLFEVTNLQSAAMFPAITLVRLHSRRQSTWAFSQLLDNLCIFQPKKSYTGRSLEKSYIGALVDYFKAEAALSKFGSSEELIDLAAKDLVCLPLGEVSDDRPPAFYPPRVAANLRQRDSVLIRPLALSCAAPLSPSPPWMLPQNGHLWPTLEMSLESVINECDGEIITQNKIIDQAGKLLSLKNVWPEESRQSTSYCQEIWRVR